MTPARARLHKLFARLGLYFSVVVLVSPAILFFLWMLSLAFKNEADNTAYLCGTEGYVEVPIPWKPPMRDAEYRIVRGTPPKMEHYAQD